MNKVRRPKLLIRVISLVDLTVAATIGILDLTWLALYGTFIGGSSGADFILQSTIFYLFFLFRFCILVTMDQTQLRPIPQANLIDLQSEAVPAGNASSLSSNSTYTTVVDNSPLQQPLFQCGAPPQMVHPVSHFSMVSHTTPHMVEHPVASSDHLHPQVYQEHTWQPRINIQSLFPSFPTFNADRDINWWLNQFEQMVLDCHPMDKTRLLLLKLGERVQDTITGMPFHLRQDYGALVNQLRTSYSTPLHSGTWYAALMNRKKKSTESITAYMRDIQRLVGKLHVHVDQRDHFICNAFLHGLPNDILLYLGPPQNISSAALLQKAIYYEEVLKRDSPHYDAPPRRVFHVRQPPSRYEQQVLQTPSPRVFHGNCFNCGQRGHSKHFCPRLTFHQSNHSSRRVTLPSHFQKSATPSLLMPVSISTLDFEFEWDPGCSCCLLHEKAWLRISKQNPALSLKPGAQILTANGDDMKVLGTVTLDLALPNNQVYSWPVVVVADIATDGFIGLDLMKACGACTNHVTDVVYFRENQAEKFNPDSCIQFQLRKKVTSVKLATDIILRAGCKKIVQVIPISPYNYCGLTMIEPDNKYCENHCITALPSANPSSSKMELAVANTSDLPVRLNAGDIIGEQCAVSGVAPLAPLKILSRKAPETQSQQISEDKFNQEMPFDVSLEHLPTSQKAMVQNLLYNFKDIFAVDSSDLGCTDILQHTIESQGPPIATRARRLPIHVQAEVQELLDDLLKCGIIQPSRSPWCSPVVVVTKSNGKKRLCIDFRKLNSVTTRDSFPLPRIEDMLNVLSGCNYFSTLDMKSGYHQMKVAPADRPKTAFSIGTGLYEWIRLPFGLVNAPATFSRMMSMLLAGLSFEEVVSYLDDVIVYSQSFYDHLDALRRVFTRFREANLKLAPEKCSLFHCETKFLGFIINKDGVKTDPEKIEKVKLFPRPHNIKTLRSFLGLASYYRKFIAHFSKIAQPLTRMLTKKFLQKKFKWSDDCEDAFQQLKIKLTSTPVLALPQFNKPFHIFTDASKFAVGCILEQVQDGQTRVIAYASQTLSPNKQKWSAFQREAYALLWASRKFRPYILGGQVTFVTDHAPLVHLRNKETIPEKVQSYFAELEQYNYSLVHKAGQQHCNADALSRIPDNSDDEDSVDVATCNSVSLPAMKISDFSAWQDQDTNLCFVKTWTTAGKPPRHTTNDSEELGIYWNSFCKLFIDKDSGALFKLTKANQTQLVVPHHKRELALELHHDAQGHRGITQTYLSIKKHLWWPKLKGDVTYWCNSCTECAVMKNTPQHKAPLRNLQAGKPHEIVAMDFVGPMSSPTKQGNVYLLVLVDHFTRYAQAIPLPNRQAQTVASAIFTHWIAIHGVMEVLHSDQAQEFESEIIGELCTLLHVKKSRSSPFHPEGNSICERLNGTLVSILKPYMMNNSDDWDTLIPSVLLAYNSTKHSSTGFTPAYLTFGRDLRLPSQVVFPPPLSAKEPQMQTEYARDLRKNLQNGFQRVSNNLRKVHQQTRDKSQHYGTCNPYEVGDLVYVLTPKGSRGKLGEVWSGPWRVIARTGVIYTLTWIGDDDKRKKTRRYHYNLLKFCLPRDNRYWALTPSLEDRAKRTSKPPERFGDWDYDTV